MGDAIDYERQGNIAIIAFNNPPVNALGSALRQRFMATLEAVDGDHSVKAVVLTGRSRGFSGGADIREFGKPRAEPILSHLIDRIEALSKPIIAAAHGMATGGGCEIMLGCHYRLAAPDLMMGLPEVKLGLLPGAGGTQRLPRLVGLDAALDIILSGEYVDAERACKIGLADEIVAGDLVAGAVNFANELLAAGKGVRRVGEMQVAAANASEIFAKARNGIAKRARGLIAPERCIASIINALIMPLEDGLAQERIFFSELEQSDQSRALRHLFFAEREAHKIPGVPKDTKTREIKQAAVIGGGTMGRGIAMSFANAGLPVTILEVNGEALENSLAEIRKSYTASVAHGRLSSPEMEARLKLIAGATDYAGLAEADLVIEAVFEDMALKKQLFAEMDAICKPGAILATNTSTLDVDEIAVATARPQDVIGMHFFSPAHVMKLMENVRGKKTSAEVVATVMKLSKNIGKVGVLVGVCDGFVGNRMLYAYRNQADFLLEEGALPQQIDRVLYDFGFPMGPFAMGDLAGLDVGYRARQHRRRTRPSDERTSFIADRIVEMGRLGQKNGKGWYVYKEGSREPIPDPEIEKLILAVSEELGIKRRSMTDEEILERCLYPLINEGAKLLAEGIAIRPSDIDLVWVHGYGFPRGKGGPMFHAGHIGVKAVHKKMTELFEIHGEMLRPAALLEELAKAGKTFAEL